jgi:hypothetical protein
LLVLSLNGESIPLVSIPQIGVFFLIGSNSFLWLVGKVERDYYFKAMVWGIALTGPLYIELFAFNLNFVCTELVLVRVRDFVFQLLVQGAQKKITTSRLIDIIHRLIWTASTCVC